MPQVLYQQCLDGHCSHAPFPHKTVHIAQTTRTVTRNVPTSSGGTRRVRVTETVPERTMVICLKCGHWPNSKKDTCFCKEQCHIIAQAIDIP